MNFGSRLRQLRNEKGLTQAELAQKLSLGESTISFYEANKREPDYKTLLCFADFFKVSVDYLLGHSDQRNDQTMSLIEEMARQMNVPTNVLTEAKNRVVKAREQIYHRDTEQAKKMQLANELNELIDNLPLEDLKFLKITAEHLNRVKKTTDEQSVARE